MCYKGFSIWAQAVCARSTMRLRRPPYLTSARLVCDFVIHRPCAHTIHSYPPHFQAVNPIRGKRACTTEAHLNLLFSSACAQHSSQWRGGGICFSFPSDRFPTLTNCPRLSPHSGLLCFHVLTNRPICKSLVLTTLQQYLGVSGAPRRFSSSFTITHCLGSRTELVATRGHLCFSLVGSHESPSVTAISPIARVSAQCQNDHVRPCTSNYWETKPLPSVSKEGERTAGSASARQSYPASGRSPVWGLGMQGDPSFAFRSNAKSVAGRKGRQCPIGLVP